MKKRRNLFTLPALMLLLLLTSCLTPFYSPVLEFSPTNLPKARLGAFYEVTVRVSRNQTPVGEFSISQGSLPNGLKIERVVGEDAIRILGIPEETGPSRFTISVWCFGTNASGQTGQRQYTIMVVR